MDESYDPRVMEIFMASLERILTENQNLKILLSTSNHMFANSPHPNNQHLHYYLRDLAELLSTSSITEIDVSDNNIIGYHGKQLSGLSHLVRKFLVPKGEGFTCRLSRLHSRSLFFISEAFGPHSRIAYLDLSDNPLDLDVNNTKSMEGIQQLTMMMAQTSTLKTVKFARCGLCDDALVLVFTAIGRADHIQTVDVSGNEMSELGAEAMKAAIVSHGLPLGPGRCLTNLDLSNNPLGNMGAAYVAEAMACSSTLITLNIANCGIDKKPMAMLVKALTTNVALKQIDIGQNPSPESVMTRVWAEVEANNLLVALSEQPLGVNALELTLPTHEALMKKLKYLSQRTLYAMHRNSSFNVPGSAMKETLFLLKAPVRHTRIMEAFPQSTTIGERLDHQAVVLTRVNASFIIFEVCNAYLTRRRVLRDKRITNEKGKQAVALMMHNKFVKKEMKAFRKGGQL
jgi:Ran GTPase-activating protein (RanGAP) involved in mRNA processing and transport